MQKEITLEYFALGENAAYFFPVFNIPTNIRISRLMKLSQHQYWGNLSNTNVHYFHSKF